MLSGTGWLMISLKKSSPSRILLSHNTRSLGRFGSHQKSPRSTTREAMKLFSRVCLRSSTQRWRENKRSI